MSQPKPDPSIFDQADLAAEERDADQADADAAAERVIPHAEVAKWLKTWGTPQEGPPPKEWGLDD